MSDFLTRRGGVWHFVRRVPAEFASIDRRGIIRHSTRVRIRDDRLGRHAARVADRLNRELELHWKSKVSESGSANPSRYNDARRRARELGYDYVAAEQLIAQPVERILERLEALVAKGLTQDQGARTALLGTEKPEAFPLSRLFIEYEAATR